MGHASVATTGKYLPAPVIALQNTWGGVGSPVIVQPEPSHSDMCISPTNKCKVSLSGGRGYLGGLHATHFAIQSISILLGLKAPCTLTGNLAFPYPRHLKSSSPQMPVQDNETKGGNFPGKVIIVDSTVAS